VDLLRVAGRLLTSRFSGPLLDLVTSLAYHDTLRRLLLRAASQRLRAALEDPGRAGPRPGRIARERTWSACAILHTVDRLIGRRILAPHVVRRVLELWGRALCRPAEDRPAWRRFRGQHGCGPPWFLTISPGHACNLRCAGCYADAEGGNAQLPWSILDRLMAEARDLWEIPLFVLSGGEPLAYRSEGRDILDAVEAHPDALFLMFTNGTLIDRPTAARLARLRNVTPALSVEGLRERTDERRGAGVFDRVLEAMAYLREAGVPFGISVTATRSNCEEVLSDEFLDLFFAEQGAFYGFLFHYMPIGRSHSLEPVPTPAQRLAFWRRSWEVVSTKQIFLFDFWNYGPLAQGCLSAGREGGYMYIDWNGRVMPCVFAPYSVGNVQELYRRGGTLEDLWGAPLFQAIRQWQRDYGYGRPAPSADGNWLRPCPIRDHYRLFREWIARYQPEPEDEGARQALLDGEYYEQMLAYDQELEQLSQPIWQREYLDG
jgi:MoaA/NifB/PqqE/SkfB family radical SAM enzyme